MMKKDIYKFPGLMLALLTGSSLFAQTIHNNGARIVSQSETYRVIDNGNFTLKSESSTDLPPLPISKSRQMPPLQLLQIVV